MLASAMVSVTMAGELQHRPADENQWPENLIRAVQDKLNKLGLDAGVADGKLGPRTRQAIRAFQQHQNLPVDGHISTSLLKALDFDQ